MCRYPGHAEGSTQDLRRFREYDQPQGDRVFLLQVRGKANLRKTIWPDRTKSATPSSESAAVDAEIVGYKGGIEAKI